MQRSLRHALKTHPALVQGLGGSSQAALPALSALAGEQVRGWQGFRGQGLALEPWALTRHLACRAEPCGRQQEQRSWWASAIAGAATAVGGAAVAHALLWPAPAARCEPRPAPASFASGGAAGSGASAASASWSWVPGWLSRAWGGGRSKQPENEFLKAIGEDPRVAVALAFALPSLSL